MEHAVRHRGLARIDELATSEVEAEGDGLGLVAGLRIAVPLGIGIWALLIWGVVHFLV
jgi:hypothetical protein